jgi:hypothetical protein
MFIVTSAASGVELSVTGAPTGPIAPGTLVTLNIRMSNNSHSVVYGVGASVHGYGGNMQFVSGVAVQKFFCPTAACTTGSLPNLVGPTLAEQPPVGANGPYVPFAQSVSTSAHPQDCSLDRGLDNVVGSAEFRVTLRAIAGGSGHFTLYVDSSYPGDTVVLTGGATESIAGQSYAITVVPPVPVLPYVLEER